MAGSKANAYQVEMQLKAYDKWHSLGQTELLPGTNPKFLKAIIANYIFEEKQICQIIIKDAKEVLAKFQTSIGFILNKL